MEYIYVGYMASTHGIKGEIKLKSNFNLKTKAFSINNNIYIGNNKEEYKITSYRTHKGYDMIILEGFDNINDVLKFKGQKFYVLRDDLSLNEDEIIDTDLLNIEVLVDNKKIGYIKSIESITTTKKILVIDIEGKEVLIPYEKEFIDHIDLNKKCIYIKPIKGMIE